MYKKLLVLADTKLVACLLASDFPSENPRPQTRNFPYTNTLNEPIKKTGHTNQSLSQRLILFFINNNFRQNFTQNL